MLSELLKLMTENHLSTTVEMAQKLGWTQRKVETVLEQLENIGYLEKRFAAGSCHASGCSGCSGCSLGKEGKCQEMPDDQKLFTWVITERGKRALR